jgi:hypothetical protein
MSPITTHGRRLLQQPDRTFDGRWAQVRIPLGRRQILMAGQFLNRPRRRAAHREV